MRQVSLLADVFLEASEQSESELKLRAPWPRLAELSSLSARSGRLASESHGVLGWLASSGMSERGGELGRERVLEEQEEERELPHLPWKSGIDATWRMRRCGVGPGSVSWATCEQEVDAVSSGLVGSCRRPGLPAPWGPARSRCRSGAAWEDAGDGVVGPVRGEASSTRGSTSTTPRGRLHGCTPTKCGQLELLPSAAPREPHGARPRCCCRSRPGAGCAHCWRATRTLASPKSVTFACGTSWKLATGSWSSTFRLFRSRCMIWGDCPCR
mmetsp:Transcript_42016/g.112801  ORF Transcript_42016/g.112801 Transcript_42016/m.112801 type:complete len:270 (-) Transcript_42016:514-1323(-)